MLVFSVTLSLSDEAMRLFLHQVIPNDQRVYLRAQEALDGLLRGASDGLVLVQGGVEHHRSVSRIP